MSDANHVGRLVRAAEPMNQQHTRRAGRPIRRAVVVQDELIALGRRYHVLLREIGDPFSGVPGSEDRLCMTGPQPEMRHKVGPKLFGTLRNGAHAGTL